MAQIILPQRYLSQPQYHVEIAPEYADAEVLALFNTGEWRDLSGNHSLSSLTPPTPTVNSHGRSQRYGDVLGTHIRTSGSIPALSRFTAFAWVRPGTMGSGYKRILETNYSAHFYLGSSNTGNQYNFIVANSSLSACVGGQQVVGKRDFVAGVYDGTNCILYVNGREAARTTASAPFAAEPLFIGANRGNTNSGEHWVGDIDTVAVFPRAFSADQMLSLNNDPYQLLVRSARRLFFTPSAPSSDSTGSSSGSSTVSGIGASVSESTGSSSGTSTASGVGSSGSVSESTGTATGASTASATGSSVADSVGSSFGLASASGIGVAEIPASGTAAGTSTASAVGVSATGSSGTASGTSTANASGSSVAASNGVANGVAAASGIGSSVAAVSGTASGLATVAGVGDSIIPGSATGTASGTSTASGIGASIAESTGSASGDSTATGRGSSTGGAVESYSGGYLYISREEHAERRRKQRVKLGILHEMPIRPESNAGAGLERFDPVLPIAKKKLIPARQKKIDHEAINAELKALLKKQIQIEEELEEQTILKMLMEL